MYQLSSQAGLNRYEAHTRILLAAVVVIVLILLPVVLIRAVQLSEELQAARLEVTDDQTWVVAQLEVEYLKLAVAIGELRSMKAGSISEADLQERMPNILNRFDIFYSRVGTVASKIRSWSESSHQWNKSLRILDRVIYRRNQLAIILDRSATPGGRLWVDALEMNMADFAEDVRELSVTTLANLSDQATERRLLYISKQRTLLIQSVTLVVVMAAICMLALILFRQVGVRAAAERRVSENLSRVFDAKPDAILLTDANRRILWMNKAAAELLDVDLTVEAHAHPLDFFFPGIQRLIHQGKTHPLDRSDQSSTFRDIVRQTGGAIVAVEVTRVQLMEENGKNTNALFVRNISETQRALRALRRERRLAEGEAERYQRFLATMSHEIRSPLHAIMASLDLARQRPGATALADLHDIAMDAARIVLREADAVLENGRAEHEMNVAERGVFSASEILTNLVEMNGPAAHSAGTKLAVEIEPEADVPIHGLRACYWHAAANLLSNAVKFTSNGKITVRLTRVEDALRVEVADTGPGISPDLLDAIFRDHYTHNPVTVTTGKGAGLGLGLFVKAVRAMDGRYGVESIVGKGSTFWFTFPARSATLPKSAEHQDLPGLGHLRSDLRVLVVDDSHVNRSLIHQMFSMLGLQADLAESGTEAVSRAEEFGYDLILMDLSMPHMDGYTAAAKIRREGASNSAMIVALTANVLARQEVEKQGSFDGFLLKPLRFDELRTWLAGGLHQQPLPQGGVPSSIDRAVAQDLLDTLPLSTLETLLKAFLDELEDLVASLDSYSRDADLSGKFHKVASSASMLGAARLRDLSLEGEAAAKKTDYRLKPTFRTVFLQAISETSHDWALLLKSGSQDMPFYVER